MIIWKGETLVSLVLLTLLIGGFFVYLGAEALVKWWRRK